MLDIMGILFDKVDFGMNVLLKVLVELGDELWCLIDFYFN